MLDVTKILELRDGWLAKALHLTRRGCDSSRSCGGSFGRALFQTVR